MDESAIYTVKQLHALFRFGCSPAVSRILIEPERMPALTFHNCVRASLQPSDDDDDDDDRYFIDPRGEM